MTPEEFLKKYGEEIKIFMPTTFQQALLRILRKEDLPKLKLLDCARAQEKCYWMNEYSCTMLLGMEEGETFSLVSTDGVMVFRLEKIEKHADSIRGHSSNAREWFRDRARDLSAWDDFFEIEQEKKDA